MLQGLAALQLEDVGAVTGAVTRATTRALTKARSIPKMMLATETEAGAGGHKRLAQPPRASPEPLALTTQSTPDRRSPLMAETARLLKDHAYSAGSQKPDATLGSMFKE